MMKIESRTWYKLEFFGKEQLFVLLFSRLNRERSEEFAWKTFQSTASVRRAGHGAGAVFHCGHGCRERGKAAGAGGTHRRSQAVLPGRCGGEAAD